ncbi:CD40 ligand [Protopterus annectens]
MQGNYNPDEGKPLNTGFSAIMKTVICCVFILMLAQIIGTVLYCVYLHMKLDKIQEEMTFHEDFVFLRRLQKCAKGEDLDNTFLNCNHIVNEFHNLLSKVKTNTGTYEKYKAETSPAMQIDAEKVVVAAHLAGTSKKVEASNVLQWAEKGYSVLQPRLINREGYVRIGDPGLYYVYSQISFCENTSSQSREPFVQYIYLKKANLVKKMLLLKGAHAQSSYKDQSCGLHSIHQGGVFDLSNGDELFVNVTDASRVNYSEGSTYFGLFKLGNFYSDGSVKETQEQR